MRRHPGVQRRRAARERTNKHEHPGEATSFSLKAANLNLSLSQPRSVPGPKAE